MRIDKTSKNPRKILKVSGLIATLMKLSVDTNHSGLSVYSLSVNTGELCACMPIMPPFVRLAQEFTNLSHRPVSIRLGAEHQIFVLALGMKIETLPFPSPRVSNVILQVEVVLGYMQVPFIVFLMFR